ncbi:hypothetical protein [Thiobacillus sp. 65-1402]|uniref:hypothetical protein n=1 Tax=Thiobacillus sp. 65-1402 TaxID=1895861 RepID=UPI00086A0CC4|nr:hypothetical protein [Thiobacillus sp. 65-1402]ODU04043.1 MAG: hypothetical protein ABS89_04040 [Thiobacillus sp. SCN 63-1177]
MARFGLKNRLAKLENKRFAEYGTQLAVEYECDASGTPADAFMRDWLSGVAPAKKTQQRADLTPSRPIFARRVILVPTFSDWEAACLAQQKALQAVCRSRTNEPAQVAPPSVGKSEAFTEAAPLQPGTKRGRFIELADGRTFDRETGEFLEEAAKALPAGGLKAIYQH